MNTNNNKISEAEKERITKWVTNHYSVRINPIVLIGGRSENVWHISCTYDKKYSFPIEVNYNMTNQQDSGNNEVVSVSQVKTAIFKLIDEIITDVEKKIIEEADEKSKDNAIPVQK